MIIFHSISNNPSFNLAWEEYIMKHHYKDVDIFLLWQNNPSVIIGRNQNIFDEVNLLYAFDNHIPIFRRNSGGGTVYHDLGNINFTFITNAKDKVNRYQLMITPIIKALNDLGIDASFHPKSDIYIHNKKIGGNAQYLYKGVLLHHGTILFNANLDVLNKVLNPSIESQTTAVQSRRAIVTNINKFSALDQHTLIERLVGLIAPNHVVKTLLAHEIDLIKTIEKEKYLTDSWNYQQSPQSTLSKRTSDYQIDLEIEGGIIKKVTLLKQGKRQPNIEKRLLNVPLTVKNLLFLKTEFIKIFHLIFK